MHISPIVTLAIAIGFSPTGHSIEVKVERAVTTRLAPHTALTFFQLGQGLPGSPDIVHKRSD